MLPHFDYSETFIPFDANIKMQDEGELSSMYVGKNLHQLQVSIDSIRPILDSTRNSYARIVQSDLLTSHYASHPTPTRIPRSSPASRSVSLLS